MVIVKTIVDFLFQFLSYMYAFNKIHFWFDLLEHFWLTFCSQEITKIYSHAMLVKNSWKQSFYQQSY